MWAGQPGVHSVAGEPCRASDTCVPARQETPIAARRPPTPTLPGCPAGEERTHHPRSHARKPPLQGRKLIMHQPEVSGRARQHRQLQEVGHLAAEHSLHRGV